MELKNETKAMMVDGVFAMVRIRIAMILVDLSVCWVPLADIMSLFDHSWKALFELILCKRY